MARVLILPTLFQKWSQGDTIIVWNLRLIDNIADSPHGSRTKTSQVDHDWKTITKHNRASQITIDGSIRSKPNHRMCYCRCEHDVTVNQLESMSDLIEYCYQVAGTVGLMMCDLMQIHSRQARLHAVDLDPMHWQTSLATYGKIVY